MAQQPLLLLEAVDVRRATQVGTSRANTISTLTIPTITFVEAEHNPGGGIMAVNYLQRRIEALEPAFTSKGLDRDVFRGMGKRDAWTFASAYRNKDTGIAVPARGIIEGAVKQWEPDESDPAEFAGCNHMFAEVTHFEFRLGDEEWIYFDAQERVARLMGDDLFADIRKALGA